jgi:hypothetical protein
MKLISITDFVLEQAKDNNKQRLNKYSDIVCYAKFLKQPLKLEMFVPCNEDGNVIELPNACICTDLCSLCKKYKKAKEKVLFEGFEKENTKFLEGLIYNETIESGLQLNGNIKLTANAIKRIFG